MARGSRSSGGPVESVRFIDQQVVSSHSLRNYIHSDHVLRVRHCDRHSLYIYRRFQQVPSLRAYGPKWPDRLPKRHSPKNHWKSLFQLSKASNARAVRYMRHFIYTFRKAHNSSPGITTKISFSFFVSQLLIKRQRPSSLKCPLRAD